MARTRRRSAVTIIVIVVVWVVSLAFYQPAWLIRVLQTYLTDVLFEVPAAGNRVAVTFDDGPDPRNTPRVLDILRVHHAKATFFLTGRNAAAFPSLVTQIRAEGHLVANHLLEDAYVLFKTTSELEHELISTERVLFIGQDQPKYVRPPRGWFGATFRAVANRHGYRIVIGSAYVSDPYRPPARYIAFAMKKMLRPGAILVLHDGGGHRENTLTALPLILEAGRRRGLEFVTLAELQRSSP
jgi:peptidoglycan/xylan/chitin deacetylase (PgdA/CDA1 family)